MRRKFLKGLCSVFAAILLSGCVGEITEEGNSGNAYLEGENDEDYGDLFAEDIGEDSYFTDQMSDVGEMALVENQVAADKSDGSDEVDSNSVKKDETSVTIEGGFFSDAKLTREQMRAKNKELLMSVVSDSTVADELKQQAIDEIIALTARAECENAAEILLEAKGYRGVVVTLLENEVEVVVNAESITEQQIAQIEDIVSRKTGVGADGIVITTVVVEE